jgi:drug/metabolite transporter (DMT)-like permease
LSLFIYVTDAKFSIPHALVIPSLISGVFALGMIAALYIAVKSFDVGIATLILSLYPAVLALFYHFQRHEFLSSFQWICLSIVLVGLALLISDQTFQNDLSGLLMSCFTLFCAVNFTIISTA